MCIHLKYKCHACALISKISTSCVCIFVICPKFYIHTFINTHILTEIPTIMDPSATINHPSAAGSVIVGISVCTCMRLCNRTLCIHTSNIYMIYCLIFMYVAPQSYLVHIYITIIIHIQSIYVCSTTVIPFSYIHIHNHTYTFIHIHNHSIVPAHTMYVYK